MRVAGRAELGFTCPQLAAAFVGGRAASGLGVHLHLEECTESLGSSPTTQPGLVKPITQAVALCSGDGQLSSLRPSLHL